MKTFRYLGAEYRTNADASVVERHDRKTWTRTYSAGVRTAALAALDPPDDSTFGFDAGAAKKYRGTREIEDPSTPEGTRVYLRSASCRQCTKQRKSGYCDGCACPCHDVNVYGDEEEYAARVTYSVEGGVEMAWRDAGAITISGRRLAMTPEGARALADLLQRAANLAEDPES